MQRRPNTCTCETPAQKVSQECPNEYKHGCGNVTGEFWLKSHFTRQTWKNIIMQITADFQ